MTPVATTTIRRGAAALALSLTAAMSLSDRTSAGRETASTVPASAERRYPTLETAGVPAGWEPTETLREDYVVRDAGEVVADVRIHGNLVVAAPNVTIRRVEIVGGVIRNVQGSTCQNGLLIEDVTIRRGAEPTHGHEPSIAHGGYIARNVAIDGQPEGFRVGGADAGCGPVVIEDSIARVVAPDECHDWHGDGIQGYIGAEVTVRNTVLELVEREDCGGTAPFFYPEDQGNTSVDIQRLLVKGGGYPFRLGTPGRVEDLHIVADSWLYHPYNVDCALVSSWSAWVAHLDDDGQPIDATPIDCRDPGE